MFAARLARIPTVLCTSASQTLKNAHPNTTPRLVMSLRSQPYASQTRLGARRAAKVKSLKEAAEAPAAGTADMMGRGLLIGASAAGIGALCYYGLGLSREVGAIERAAIWPQYVRDRVRSTYTYFGLGVAATAASAVAMARNPALLIRLTPTSWVGALGGMAVIMASGMVTMSVPYTEGLGLKQLAWLGHSSLLGVVLAPMCFLGGPLLIRAACYTAGVVGGLSCIAACAPSDKFLYMGGTLAMGLGAVIAASIGSMFLSPASALGSGLYAVSLYGGLVLFGGFMLYDTQMIMKRAEVHPLHAQRPFDPINNAMSIYMDTINIFIRIATILANGGGGRRK
ncbi:growth hormone-inducible transmembrane protein-like [Diadema antillarum]|uniref:growth hormone-inducible transmembrane protein-like n=1 Tax=Diadema antillarum TaxID=105358 RepID=UPI003A8C87EC